MINPDGAARITGPCGDTMQMHIRVYGDKIVNSMDVSEVNKSGQNAVSLSDPEARFMENGLCSRPCKPCKGLIHRLLWTTILG